MSPVWKVWRNNVTIGEENFEAVVVRAETLGLSEIHYGGVILPFQLNEDELTIHPYTVEVSNEARVGFGGVLADGEIELGVGASIIELKLLPDKGGSYLRIIPGGETDEAKLGSMYLERHSEAPKPFGSYLNKERA